LREYFLDFFDDEGSVLEVAFKGSFVECLEAQADFSLGSPDLLVHVAAHLLLEQLVEHFDKASGLDRADAVVQGVDRVGVDREHVHDVVVVELIQGLLGGVDFEVQFLLHLHHDLVRTFALALPLAAQGLAVHVGREAFVVLKQVGGVFGLQVLFGIHIERGNESLQLKQFTLLEHIVRFEQVILLVQKYLLRVECELGEGQNFLVDHDEFGSVKLEHGRAGSLVFDDLDLWQFSVQSAEMGRTDLVQHFHNGIQIDFDLISVFVHTFVE